MGAIAIKAKPEPIFVQTQSTEMGLDAFGMTSFLRLLVENASARAATGVFMPHLDSSAQVEYSEGIVRDHEDRHQ